MAETIFFAALTALAGGCALSDCLTRRIPNLANLAILVAGIAALFFDPSAGPWWSHLIHFAIALAGSLLLFRFGVWGGGDAKFYAAVALWYPLDKAGLLALATALAGALLVVVIFVSTKGATRKRWLAAMPYGVAIAAAAIGIRALQVFGGLA